MDTKASGQSKPITSPLPPETRALASAALHVHDGTSATLVDSIRTLGAAALKGDPQQLVELLAVAVTATIALGRAVAEQPELARRVGGAALVWPVLRSPVGTLDNALAEGSGFQKVLDAHHALYSAEKPPRPDFLSDSGKLALEALSVLTLIKTQLVPLPANYQQLCEAVKLLKPLSKSTLKDWWAVGRHYLEVAYSSNLAEVAFQTTGSPGRTNKCDAIDSIKRSFYTIAEVFSVLQSGRQ